MILRDHPDSPRCLVNKLYTYTSGRLPFPSEKDMLEFLQGDMADADNRFDRLLFALVTHDDFRFANPPDTVLAPDEGDGQ
jgi:hypothetical protein